MYKFLVLDAVYGALQQQQPTRSQTAYVRDQLQALLNQNPVVTIDNPTLGIDPCVGMGKHFAATVSVNGQLFFFAGGEHDTIDFRYYNGQQIPPLKNAE